MRQKNLPVVWTKHLSEAEREAMEKSVRNSTIVLSRLREIIDEQLNGLDRMEESDEFYEKYDYHRHQPFVNGRRRALKDIRKLLDFIE